MTQKDERVRPNRGEFICNCKLNKGRESAWNEEKPGTSLVLGCLIPAKRLNNKVIIAA
jgi:hypothetical protein